jgi:hypothetical protein
MKKNKGIVGLLPTPAYTFLRAQKGVSPKRAPAQCRPSAALRDRFSRGSANSPFGLRHADPFIRLSRSARLHCDGTLKTQEAHLKNDFIIEYLKNKTPSPLRQSSDPLKILKLLFQRGIKQTYFPYKIDIAPFIAGRCTKNPIFTKSLHYRRTRFALSGLQ